MDNTISNTDIKMEIKSHDSDQLSEDSANRKDNEYYLKYFAEKMSTYEENINTTYYNIKRVLTQLEEEFPEIDMTSKFI
jgi:hypothetical protein